jgi:hypothetical protein
MIFSIEIYLDSCKKLSFYVLDYQKEGQGSMLDKIRSVVLAPFGLKAG